jgi:hypothetical protein
MGVGRIAVGLEAVGKVSVVFDVVNPENNLKKVSVKKQFVRFYKKTFTLFLNRKMPNSKSVSAILV